MIPDLIDLMHPCRIAFIYLEIAVSVVKFDDTLSAQFEHTVTVAADGVKVLTLTEGQAALI